VADPKSIADVNKAIEALETDITNQFGSLQTAFQNSLDKEITAVGTKIVALQTSVEKDVTAVGVRITTLQTTIEKDLKAVDAKIVALQSGVEKDIKALDGKVDWLRTGERWLLGLLVASFASSGAIYLQLGTVQEAVKQLHPRVEQIGKDVADAKDRLAKIDVNRLDALMKRADATVTNLEGLTTRVGTAVDQSQSPVVQRLDRIDDSIRRLAPSRDRPPDASAIALDARAVDRIREFFRTVRNWERGETIVKVGQRAPEQFPLFPTPPNLLADVPALKGTRYFLDARTNIVAFVTQADNVIVAIVTILA
jgi:archaellum component FlaC